MLLLLLLLFTSLSSFFFFSFFYHLKKRWIGPCTSKSQTNEPGTLMNRPQYIHIHTHTHTHSFSHSHTHSLTHVAQSIYVYFSSHAAMKRPHSNFHKLGAPSKAKCYKLGFCRLMGLTACLRVRGPHEPPNTTLPGACWRWIHRLNKTRGGGGVWKCGSHADKPKFKMAGAG